MVDQSSWGDLPEDLKRHYSTFGDAGDQLVNFAAAALSGELDQVADETTQAIAMARESLQRLQADRHLSHQAYQGVKDELDESVARLLEALNTYETGVGQAWEVATAREMWQVWDYTAMLERRAELEAIYNTCLLGSAKKLTDEYHHFQSEVKKAIDAGAPEDLQSHVSDWPVWCLLTFRFIGKVGLFLEAATGKFAQYAARQ